MCTLVEGFAAFIAQQVPTGTRRGQRHPTTRQTEAVMDTVQRIDSFLMKAKTSWLTPFMGGAFAGVFLFWV